MTRALTLRRHALVSSGTLVAPDPIDVNLTMVNNGFEEGTMNGWTTISGGWTASTSFKQGGTYAGRTTTTGVLHELIQYIDVSAYAANIDFGNTAVDLSVYVKSDGGDQNKIRPEFYDAGLVLISAGTYSGIVPGNNFELTQVLDEPVPVGTRHIGFKFWSQAVDTARSYYDIASMRLFTLPSIAPGYDIGGTDPIWVADYVGQYYWGPEEYNSETTFAGMHTFSRAAGTRRYCNAKGDYTEAGTNVPVFEKNINTGADLGLSIEPAATEYAQRNISYNFSPWFSNQLAIASDNTPPLGPTGDTLGDRMTVLTPGTDPFVGQNVTAGSAQTWTFAFWVYGTSGNQVNILSYRDSVLEVAQTPPFVLDGDWNRFSQTRTFATPPSQITFRLEGVPGTNSQYWVWGATATKLPRISSWIYNSSTTLNSRQADVVTIDGMTGTYDVRVTYGDDNTTHDFLSESVGATYWPAGLTQYNIKSVAGYPAGTL